MKEDTGGGRLRTGGCWGWFNTGVRWHLRCRSTEQFVVRGYFGLGGECIQVVELEMLVIRTESTIQSNGGEVAINM